MHGDTHLIQLIPALRRPGYEKSVQQANKLNENLEEGVEAERKVIIIDVIKCQLAKQRIKRVSAHMA